MAPDEVLLLLQMAYHLTTQFGADESDPSPERMAEVLDTIDPNDVEHTDVFPHA